MFPIEAKVSWLMSLDGNWNLELLCNCFTENEVALILSIPIPNYHIKDKLIWHFSRNGVYTVKSGYWAT
ncbi:hypothetical protein RchiOBHm_Chr5g0012551 [Rosa chinensis]|uniref:Uncharacterized protein n=1 Tax=Rosa chinensis TaxID=74649 RepID=A0A2P6Q552_ROSCH|nr:hypothetical protein RchiOBHm_Chr5g0012551 [Rosa chinensis]